MLLHVFRTVKFPLLKLLKPAFIVLWFICASIHTLAQGLDSHETQGNSLDLVDLVTEAMHRENTKRADTTHHQTPRLRVSAVPAAGYTLQTGFAGLITANGAFKLDPSTNTSTILTSFTYTARNQIIVPLQANIWTKNNKYNFVGDWRYLKYPSYTYGLGGYTTLDQGYLIDYNAFRIHQTLLRQIRQDMYFGVGYNLDYFWNIKELDPPVGQQTDFQKYGLGQTELSSGITFNFLYDNRKNSINPENGNFVNIIYRPNLTAFGNANTWRSLVLDLRKYIRFNKNSDNVLALWSYEWLTLSGKPPYLMLPNTGSDPYSNTGRGYIQGRFRGTNMAYAEAEYRFSVSRNGLFGGVVFANAESFTELNSNRFETLAPGWGGGIRIKLNKYSRTNIAIDYGFGLGGSQGLFVNLGEVF